MTKTETILALDASTTHVGMSVWTNDRYEGGCQRRYPGSDIFRRVLAIRTDVARWSQKNMATIIVAERPIYDPRHGPDTLYELAMPIAAIALWATEHRVRFETVYPTSVKSALGGTSRASKRTMIRLAELYLENRERIAGEHHADSIGVFAAFWGTLKTERIKAMAQ